jgi:hypothetical protein
LSPGVPSGPKGWGVVNRFALEGFAAAEPPKHNIHTVFIILMENQVKKQRPWFSHTSFQYLE